jgi:hypothetical protein
VFPPSVRAAVKAATAAHPDARDQKVAAIRAVRALPEYPDLVDALVDEAIGDMVQAERHVNNEKIRREAGVYGGPAKTLGLGRYVEAAARDLLSTYYIAGTVLGHMLGEQLIPMAESEEAAAEGHLFNARLGRTLRPLVPDGVRVGMVVSNRRMRRIFKQLGRPLDDAA